MGLGMSPCFKINIYNSLEGLKVLGEEFLPIITVKSHNPTFKQKVFYVNKEKCGWGWIMGCIAFMVLFYISD